MINPSESPGFCIGYVLISFNRQLAGFFGGVELPESVNVSIIISLITRVYLYKYSCLSISTVF